MADLPKTHKTPSRKKSVKQPSQAAQQPSQAAQQSVELPEWLWPTPLRPPPSKAAQPPSQAAQLPPPQPRPPRVMYTSPPFPQVQEGVFKSIGIYARCHGQLTGKTILSPPNAVLNKHSIAAYGATCNEVHSKDLDPENMARHLQHEIFGCSQEKYEQLHSPYFDEFGVKRVTKDTCQVYNGNKNWYEKIYSIDSPEQAKLREPLLPGQYLLLSCENRTINLLLCTQEEWVDFFNTFNEKYNEDPIVRKRNFDMIMKCSKFITLRSKPVVSTGAIFNAIHLLTTLIPKPSHSVNFLDESCCAMLQSEPQIVKVNGKEIPNYCVDISKLDPKDPRAGLGGKRTRRKVKKYKTTRK